jgi:hypothetical protein
MLVVSFAVVIRYTYAIDRLGWTIIINISFIELYVSELTVQFR